MKTILVCGSRVFTEMQMVDTALNLVDPDIVIHGAARGADSLAASWCRSHPRVYEIAVPAKWDLQGKSAGMARNAAMIALKPDLVLAFFATGAANRGTSGMVRLATEAGVHVESFWA